MGPPPNRRRHRQPAAGGAENDVIARFGAFTEVEGVIQGGGDAGRAEIAPLVHDRVGLAHGLAQVVHHEFDGAQVELGEDEEIDVVDGEAALRTTRISGGQ